MSTPANPLFHPLQESGCSALHPLRSSTPGAANYFSINWERDSIYWYPLCRCQNVAKDLLREFCDSNTELNLKLLCFMNYSFINQKFK